jgi:hypothetical protein
MKQETQAGFRTNRRRWGAAAALVTTLVAAFVGASVLIVASPAAASTVPNATVPSDITAFDSTPEKTIETKCPAGKRVIGGGVRVNNGDHVKVIRQEPISSNGVDSYLATAVEDSVGTNSFWALQSYAVCSDPIPGLEIVSAIGPTGSTVAGFAGITALCPGGKNAIGSGGRILDGQGRVSLVTQIIGLSRADAGGLEDLGGFSGNWSVIAFAVCARLTTLSDLQVVQNFSVTDDSKTKILTAVCPPGKQVTGGTGWADLPGVIASVNIDAARTRVQVIARDFNASDTFGWRIIAMAFCVA